MIAPAPQFVDVEPATSPAAPAVRKGWTASRVSVFLLLVYLGIVCTEGFLRWALSRLNLEPALYLRDLCALTSMLLAATMSGLGRRNLVFIGLGLQLLLAGVVGFFYSGSIPQVAFGIKIFIPLLIGVAVYPAIVRNWNLFLRGCAMLLAVVVTGVVINVFFHYPWIGTDFTIGGVTVETSREWIEVDGRDRLPGFSRNSVDAAAQVLFFTLFTLYGVRRFWKRAAIALVSLLAVALTTSKAPFVCLLAIVANFFLLEAIPGLRRPAPRTFAAKVRTIALFGLRMQIVFFTLATILLPLNATGMLDLLERDLREHSKFHLMSMQDRAARFWPLAMEHIHRHGDPWFGAGAGGVGTPLDTFGNVEIPITCDNTFLYAYGVFGLFIVPYVVCFLWFIFTRRLVAPGGSTLVGLLALAAAVQALSNASFEGIYDSVFMGFLIAHLTYGWRLLNSPLGPPAAPAA